jgi:hypothetical protein
METDILEIDNKRKEFYILTYYEGILEEVNIEEGVLFLCNEHREDETELWLMIKPNNKENLHKYLSDEEPLLDLIKSSKVFLCRRDYADYEKILLLKDISEDLDQVKLPDPRAYLGYDFISIFNLTNDKLLYDYDNKKLAYDLSEFTFAHNHLTILGHMYNYGLFIENTFKIDEMQNLVENKDFKYVPQTKIDKKNIINKKTEEYKLENDYSLAA